MKYRMLPFFLCLVLAVSVVASSSFAYAAESGEVPSSTDEGSDAGGGDSQEYKGMLATTAALGKAFMSGLWSLFGINVPGFGFTFGQLWVGVLLASVSILVVRMIFGFGGSGPGGVSPRTGSTNHPKISRERRRDEF